MLFLNYKIVYALLLICGSLSAMEKQSRDHSSGSGSRGVVTALASTRAQAAAGFQSLRAADEFNSTLAANLRGKQRYPKRFWTNDGKYAVAPCMSDGTTVLDCSHWVIEEHPRFVAQKRFFKRLDQNKAHHAQAQALWKTHPASSAEIADAEKQLKEISAIHKRFSKETVVKDLIALRAINATKVQLPFFADDGFMEYQTPAQALGKAATQMLDAITDDPDATQTLHQETQDLNFEASRIHTVIDKMVDKLKVLEQRTTISELFVRLRKPDSSYEEWIEICVSLRSIDPSKTPLHLLDSNGQLTNFTVTQVLGDILLHIMKSLGYGRGKALVMDDNAIKKGFDDAIRLLQIKQKEALQKAQADENARNEAIKQQQKQQAEVADPLLNAVKKFKQDPSELNQKALLEAKITQNYKDNADTDFLLDRIKEHIAQNNIKKAQACCAEFIKCMEA